MMSTKDDHTPRAPWDGLDEPDYIPPIRALFVQKLEGVRVSAEAMRARWAEEEGPSADDAAELYRMAHQIRGSAEPLGGVDLGRVAGELTDLFPGRIDRELPLPADLSTPLANATDRLLEEIVRYEGWARACPPGGGASPE